MGTQITSQFEIEHQAIAVLIESLPPSWIRRKQDPDFAIDYIVELPLLDGSDVNRTSGITAAIQLRGTAKCKLNARKSHVIYERYSVEDLKYFLDRCRQPAFLVVVDVNTRRGFWINLQRYVIEQLSRTNWRNKKSTRIHIPISNDISDSGALHQAILDGDVDQSARHPVAIESAIKAEQERFKCIDPRFEYKAGFVDGSKYVDIYGYEPFDFTLTIKGCNNDINGVMADLFDKGLSVDFSKYNVLAEVENLPLYPGKSIQIGGMSACAADVDVEVHLVHIQNDKEIANPVVLAGKVRGGRLVRRLHASTADLVLALDVEFAFGTDRFEVGSKQLRVDINKWQGCRVGDLAQFGIIYRLFGAWTNESSLGITIQKDECASLTGRIHIEDESSRRQIAGTIKCLADVRRIARDMKIEFRVPPAIMVEDAVAAERVCRLLDGEELSIGLADMVLELTTTHDAYEKYFGGQGMPIGNLSLCGGSWHERIFDVPVVLTPIEVRCTRAKMVLVPGEPVKKSSGGVSVKVQIITDDPVVLCMLRAESKQGSADMIE